MATMIIRGDILRAQHIEGDPALAASLRALEPEASVVLRVEGRPVRFRKGADVDGVEPEPDDLGFWRALQSRHGAMITVEPETPAVDPYLLSLTASLAEWNSPEDAAAYDGL